MIIVSPHIDATTFLRIICFYSSLILSFLTLLRANQTRCPTQCNCVPIGMSCEAPGLNRIPSPYSKQLDYLILENQTFANTHLGPSELQEYRSPEFGGQVRLNRLYIRWCNIETIGRNAFKSLGYRLQMIDLTGNPLKHIGAYAFAGLQPLILILNRIEHPEFDSHAFAGLEKMKGLFMQNSKFSTLPFEALLRLTTDGKLDQLLLTGNKIHTLSEKYDKIFGAVQEFEIQENPWHCDCRLTWLIRRYQSMSARRHTKDKNSKRRWPVAPTWGNWEQEDKPPKCATPSNMNGRNFSELITDIDNAYDQVGYKHRPSILFCPPPMLETIDINLENYLRTASQIGIGKQITNPSVKVSCVMRGSEMLQLSWQNHIPGLGTLMVPELNTTSRKSGLISTESIPWSMRGNEIFRTESMLKIKRLRDTDSYSCLGGDVMGNVSARIRINWPNMNETYHLPSKPITSTPNSLISNHTDEPSKWEQQTPIESTSVLHRPQFTLSQLLAAIIGTFVSTVLLFCLIHYTLHYPCIKCVEDVHSKSEKTQNGSIGLSPGGTSSSNASSNTANLLSTQQLPESYQSTIFPNTISPELLSLQALNLLNAHTYKQLLSGGMVYQPIHQGIGPPMPIANPTFLANDINRQNFLYTGPPDQRTQSTYEPISYSEANSHMTYDMPCLNNTNVLGQAADQRIPLLLGHRQDEATINFRDLSAPPWHPGLLIPPPPSIPQPALPPTPSSSSVRDMSSTLNRTSSSVTPNLLVLQSADHALIPPSTINSTPTSSSTSVTSVPIGT